MRTQKSWYKALAHWAKLSTNALQGKAGLKKILTPFPEVIDELYRRQNDPELRRRVEEYLGGDIPAYFGEKPVLYLARHLATRNFETLRFLSLVEPLELPIIISQDVEDKFVANNILKRSLGKLSICLSIRPKGTEFVEEYRNITIVDFASANGKKFCDIKTLWGEPLSDFHSGLLSRYTREGVIITDDSEWISRHHRGDISEHYKDFLAFFVCHGVLFEDYLISDNEELAFITEVLAPAFSHIEKIFGVKPLITQLTPTTPESGQFWVSYPKEVATIVQEKLNLTHI